MENQRDTRQLTALEGLIYNLQFGETRDFINGLRSKYSESTDLKKLESAALAIEFVDKVLGFEPETTMGNAFYYGTLIGIYIVESLHPEAEFRTKVFNKINQIIDVSFQETAHISDPNSARVAFAQKMIDCGQNGCERYPDFSLAVESIEDKFIPDATKSYYIRWGMGFALFAGDIVDEELFKAEIANGVDWNADKELLTAEFEL